MSSTTSEMYLLTVRCLVEESVGDLEGWKVFVKTSAPIDCPKRAHKPLELLALKWPHIIAILLNKLGIN